MKILTILGARPQFIKAAAISRAVRIHNLGASTDTIEEILLHTGQHFDADMSDIFFNQLNIPSPRYNLGISNLSHGAMTGRMIERIESIITTENPDWVLVYGDTNSTVAGALAASKLHVRVAHVEAGLRSHNMIMPEEINRVVTDRVSTLLLCPTNAAVANLVREGYPFEMTKSCHQSIRNTGDVMFDVTCFYREIALSTVTLDNWGLVRDDYVLCTLHRAENTDNPVRLKQIFESLNEISRECKVVMPLHPRTRKLLESTNQISYLKNLLILDPLPYIEMQRLELDARAILTDSGGIQKEAFFHKVPCITLREETEWTETVELGWNQLVGSNANTIVSAFQAIKRPVNTASPYGVGDAAKLIINSLLECR